MGNEIELKSKRGKLFPQIVKFVKHRTDEHYYCRVGDHICNTLDELGAELLNTYGDFRMEAPLSVKIAGLVEESEVFLPFSDEMAERILMGEPLHCETLAGDIVVLIPSVDTPPSDEKVGIYPYCGIVYTDCERGHELMHYSDGGLCYEYPQEDARLIVLEGSAMKALKETSQERAEPGPRVKMAKPEPEEMSEEASAENEESSPQEPVSAPNESPEGAEYPDDYLDQL